MSAPTTTFACPGCGVALVNGTTRCEHCRIRLSGELALRLWRLDQQIAALRAQREWMVTALRRDVDPDVLPTQMTETLPGTETRRVLLGLGAACLIAALTAATALIWPEIGVGGQTAVLLVVTTGLLVGAVRLGDRLPATADAIAAVGVAAVGVDLVAGRRLVAPDLSGGSSHVYWSAGTLLACAVLGFVGSRARALHSPTVGAVFASYAAVVALVSPASVSEVALVGLVGSALSAAIVALAERLPLLRRTAIRAAVAGGAAFVALGAVASLASADGPGLGLWCGLALSVGIAAVGRRSGFGAAGGLLAGALLARADIAPVHVHAVLTAGISAALVVMVMAAPRSSRTTATLAAYIGSAMLLVHAVAQRSLQADAVFGRQLTDAAIGLCFVAVVCAAGAVWSERTQQRSVAVAGAVCAVAGAVAEAFGTGGVISAADGTAVVTSLIFAFNAGYVAVAPRVRKFPGAVSVATSAAVAAGGIAALAVDVSLAWRVVRTIELFVIAPAIVTAVLGVLAMRDRPALSSWVLLPAVLVTTTPTLLAALDGDLNRQVAILCVAALMIVIGAHGRYLCLLASGTTELLLVVGRILGPEVQQLPRWLTLGVLGASLIGLGSTWERRLQDFRRVAGRMRPAVAALR